MTPPPLGPAAATATKGLLAGAKGWLVASTAAILVAGVGVGGLAIHNATANIPHLQVVQRSISQHASGPISLQQGCANHETLLGGGYNVMGGYVMESDATGERAWQVTAAPSSEGASVSLTAYALCINAVLPTKLGGYQTAYAYHDRTDKLARVSPYAEGDPDYADMTFGGPYAGVPSWPDNQVSPTCSAGYTATATGFVLDTYLKDRDGAPVPFFANGPTSPTSWTSALNAGAYIGGQGFGVDDGGDATVLLKKTLIHLRAQLAMTYNEIARVRPICVGNLKNVSLATRPITVGKGTTALDRVTCTGGKLLVGGGFTYPDNYSFSNSDGDHVIPFANDGWLYATRSAPTLDQPSGRPVTSWYVNGTNQQSNYLYANSIGRNVSPGPDGEPFTALYMIDNGGNERTDTFRPFLIPAQQRLTISALCAQSDATPTAPPTAGVSGIFLATPTSTVAVPTATPKPTATATPKPKATATPKPASQPHLNVSMPPNANFEFCSNGQWLNKITVKNTGAAPLHWNATAPSGYTLTPSGGTLAPDASVTLTITGPFYQGHTSFHVAFTSDGGQASLDIPCN